MYSKETKLGKILERIHGTPKQQIEQDLSIEQFVYGAYIKAWQLMCEKRNMLLDSLENQGKPEKNDFWYNIPCYLEYICEKIRKLMGGITKADYRNISVTILYQIPSSGESEWRSIQVSEESQKTSAEEFMKNQGIQFTKLVKEEVLHYYEDNNTHDRNEMDQDMEMKQKGIKFGIRTNFESRGQKYVNGILLISIYRHDLSEVTGYCDSVSKTFENVLVYSVLPYFIQLIETELGNMYFQEQWKSKEK